MGVGNRASLETRPQIGGIVEATPIAWLLGTVCTGEGGLVKSSLCTIVAIVTGALKLSTHEDTGRCPRVHYGESECSLQLTILRWGSRFI